MKSIFPSSPSFILSIVLLLYPHYHHDHHQQSPSLLLVQAQLGGGPTSQDFQDLANAVETNIQATNGLIDASNRSIAAVDRNALVLQNITNVLTESNDKNVRELSTTVNGAVSSLSNTTQTIVNSNDANVAKIQATVALLQQDVESTIRTIEGLTTSLNGVTAMGNTLTGTANRIVDNVNPQIDKVTVSIDDTTKTVRDMVRTTQSMYDRLETSVNLGFGFITLWVIILGVTCMVGGSDRVAARLLQSKNGGGAATMANITSSLTSRLPREYFPHSYYQRIAASSTMNKNENAVVTRGGAMMI